MQICDILVRLSDSSTATTTTPRHNVTPAEVQVLRAIKGENTVFFNGNVRNVNRSSQAEAARLQSSHGAAFFKVFAVGASNLPQTFAEVGLDISHIKEIDPYVPAPDETPLLEEFDDGDEVVAVTEGASVAPAPKSRKKPRKIVEDFSLAQ